MSEKIIEVQDLVKVFKVPKKEKNLNWFKKKISWLYREWEKKIAVENVSFTINRGEIIGYLGPNGAGKSTTIKMLTSILYPTSGTIKVFGNLSPTKDRISYTQNIGVVFGQRSILDYNIPVKDSFKLFKAIYNLDKQFYQDRLNYLIKTLQIQEIVERPYRMLSLGEKMRCELAASFIHKPQIVFLDEPTIGLDASAKIIIRKFLKKINKEENVTIMITTHDMDDIEELCKRIILIDKGKNVYDGNLKNFKKKYSNWKRVYFQYKKITNSIKFKEYIKELNIVENDSNLLIIKIPIFEPLGQYLIKLLDCLEITDIKIKEPKLENIVAKLYKTNKNE